MTHIDRRTFLTAALSVTGAACFNGRIDAAQQSTAAGNPRRIDVHHHFAPPAWIADVKGRPLLQPANTRWTPGQSIEDLDRGGVPARFGLFAAVPLPDVKAALVEIAYAYDSLKTDGIALFTSYGDTWLGNPAFRPVMEELNRRRAVVTVHPTAADCCRNLAYASGVGPGSIEYGTDTTRAIAGRIEGAASGAKEALPNGFAAELRKFHYDVAGAVNRGALASVLQVVTPTQIVFGTDFPPGGTSAAVARALAETGLFSESDLGGIDRENAVRLLPRFK